jgi:uncharacterized membrane protein/thiol-disulfide isomerase/thioredoxin
VTDISGTMHRLIIFVTLLIASSPVFYNFAEHDETKPVVDAVLFYSPTCGHCHFVITEVLPPLMEQYGDQLNIVGIDVTQATGHSLFIAALKYFNLESGGVPFLVLGNTYLMGSVDIPEKLPGLIVQYLAQGGRDWPPIPGLQEALVNIQSTLEPTIESSPAPQTTLVTTQVASIAETPASLTPTFTSTPRVGGALLVNDVLLNSWEHIKNDPTGNVIAIVVLIGMVFSVIGGIFYFKRLDIIDLRNTTSWLIPLLCLAGIGVASYLSYVEITQARAICGPVGDCNTVQQSEYARLFGILPIGILGITGYMLILVTWIIGRSANRRKAAYSCLFLVGMSALGVIFSIYLTFLEPFVIGATCAWCLTSAIIMTIMFLLNIAPGRSAFQTLYRGEKHAYKRNNFRRTLKSE